MKWDSRSAVGLPGIGGVSTNITPGRGGCTIHYVGSRVGLKPTDSHTKCRNLVRSIHRQHVNGNGWAYGAYTLVVCQPHGIVMEMRGRGRRTAANGTNTGNQHWYAILLLIGGSEEPTAEAIQGGKDAVAYLRQRGGAAKRVNGHRDHLSTSCPGEPAYRLVRRGVFGGGGSATPTGSGGGGSYRPYNRTAKPGERTLRLYDAGEDVKHVQSAVGATRDGYYGPDTTTKVRAYQSTHGLTVDGITGPQTWGRILGGAPSPAPKPPAPRAPAWPGAYLRQPPVRQSAACRTWQTRMRERGWNITVDGYYGQQSERVCRAFQREKHLTTDGVVGPQTWRASWESPVT